MSWLLRVLLAALGRGVDALVGPGRATPAEEAVITHPPLPRHPPGQVRWQRLPLVLIPASLLCGGIFYISFFAPTMFASQTHPTPNQPIPFDHQIHVQQLGLQCEFCHRTAATGVSAGLPSTQQCMDCHVAVGTAQQPLVQPLQTAWVSQQAVDWVRVWRMPDEVRFQHDVHITAGLSCTDCHGDVGVMHQVVQGQPMKMQDCIACHQRMNAPTTCATCHY